jgi:hypothetical protein
MNHRPWPIVALALSQILAPLLGFFVNAWINHMSPGALGRATLHDSISNTLLTYGPLPLAGLAIFAVKRWSYPIFLFLISWVMFRNFQVWHRYPQQVPIALLLAGYFFNLVLVSYFLIPEVRRIYRDKSLRWWENQPRYQVETPVKVTPLDGGPAIAGSVKDISEGGVFIACPGGLTLKSRIRAEFMAGGESLEVLGEVVHQGYSAGYGVRLDQTRESRQAIRRIIRTLHQARVRRRPEYFKLGDRLRGFFRTGFIPKVKS